MIVKTPGSQMGSPAAAAEGGEAMRGGKGESGESSEVHERPSLTSTAPKVRSRSRGVATLDEAPRMSLRMSSKLPTLALSSLSSIITALARTSACPSTTVAFARTSASSLTSQELDPKRFVGPCQVPHSAPGLQLWSGGRRCCEGHPAHNPCRTALCRDN